MIWAAALLSVVAIAFAGAAHRGARIAGNLLENARARALADAAVSLATLGILDPDLGTRWPVAGEARTLTLPGGGAVVTLQDEAGKVDLNEAAPEFLGGLFAELGVPDGVLAALVARRDAARARLQPGAGWSADLSDAPFRSLDELGSLPGLTAAQAARLRPFVTVYSASSRINPLTAPLAVLQAVPGMSPQVAAAFIAARGAPDAPPPRLGDLARYARPADLQAVGVRALATTAGSGVYLREAVLGLTPYPASPVVALLWEEGLAEEGAHPTIGR